VKRRVVITGLGTITSIGQDVESFWSSCLAANTRVSRIPEHWLNYGDFSSQIWSPLPEIDFSKYSITRLEEKQLDKSSLIALACAFQALDSANLRYDLADKKRNTYTIPSVKSERFGVFMGTGIGGLSTFASSFSYHILNRQKEALSKMLGRLTDNAAAESLGAIMGKMLHPRRFNPFGVSMTMPNACSGNLGIKFKLLGSNNTFCAACASGTVAVGYGFKAVRAGELDLALAGGVEHLYDDYGTIFLGFDVVHALTSKNDDPDRANCPFDKNHSGFLFSEGGGAVLVIEELEHALKRGARIYAEILSYGETSDGYNIMMIESSGQSIMRMLGQALSDAEVSADEIDYINSHGTGTTLNDETETRVIEETFGKKVLINSTKSLLGHTLGASGAIEAAVTALSIFHGTTHICRNLHNPMKDLNFITKPDSWPIRKALSQSFGFGGHNAVLILGKYS
jgi:3-oxoacyl-[acyl-carrier-protein] synthase II